MEKFNAYNVNFKQNIMKDILLSQASQPLWWGAAILPWSYII